MSGVVMAQVLDESTVSPGLVGFLVTFAVALAFIVLVRSFSKHLRKVNLAVREQQLRDEAAAQAGQDPAPQQQASVQQREPESDSPPVER